MDGQPHVGRVTATSAALAALARLREQRGAVILYQSGGCGDGSLPVCLEQGELRIGDGDVLLGSVGDVGPGEPEGFSLPADPDQHFITRSRVFSPAEQAALAEGERQI